MSKLIHGVVPVAHTPFTERDEIDWESLERQIEWMITQGIDGFCTGMVSEILRLTGDERRELTTRLAGMNGDRVPFVASVGAESSKQAVVFTEQATRAGCHGVMAIAPLSTALPDRELIGYFSAIARSTPLPVIVQDASGYVGKEIPLSVYLELLEQFGPDRILFKPEASPTGPKITALLSATNGRARVFDGSGGHLLIDAYRRGVAGTIPGVEFLEGVLALWRSLAAGDDEAAYRVYFPLCALVTLQLQAGLDGFLAVEKYVLHQRGLFTSDLRRHPHGGQLDDHTRDEVNRLMQRLADAVARCGG